MSIHCHAQAARPAALPAGDLEPDQARYPISWAKWAARNGAAGAARSLGAPTAIPSLAVRSAPLVASRAVPAVSRSAVSQPVVKQPAASRPRASFSPGQVATLRQQFAGQGAAKAAMALVVAVCAIRVGEAISPGISSGYIRDGRLPHRSTLLALHATGHADDADFAALEAVYANPASFGAAGFASAVRTAGRLCGDAADGTMKAILLLVEHWPEIDDLARRRAYTRLCQRCSAVAPGDAGITILIRSCLAADVEYAIVGCNDPDRRGA